MKKKMLLVAVLALTAVLLMACGSKPSLEGKWKPANSEEVAAFLPDVDQDKIVMEFTKDGKVLTTIDGKSLLEYMTEQLKNAGLTEEQIKSATATEPQLGFKVDGNKITMITKMGETETSAEGTFKIEGDKLTIVQGEQTMVYNKAK